MLEEVNRRGLVRELLTLKGTPEEQWRALGRLLRKHPKVP